MYLLSQDTILRQQQQQLCRYRTIASCGRYAIRYNSTVANPHFPKLSLAYYTKTYYLRDAQGNIMATYDRVYSEQDQDMLMNFSLTERPIYGSSRVANNTEEVLLVSLDETVSEDFVYYDSPDILSHTNGYKHFELTNHLGNVMAVVSDKRTPIITGSEIAGYTPELLIAKDYYPFGMEMSGRYIGAGNEDPMNEYRFGFGGQEKDDEITGQTGSVYTAMFWEYDARIGRRWNLDPLIKDWESPYACYRNNPLYFIDPSGADGVETIDKENKTINVHQKFYYNKNDKELVKNAIIDPIITPQGMSVESYVSADKEIGFESQQWEIVDNNNEKWCVTFTSEYIPLESAEEVEKMLETDETANALIYVPELESAGLWNPQTRTLSIGGQRRMSFNSNYGSTFVHEKGHSLGLPESFDIPGSPFFGWNFPPSQDHYLSEFHNGLTITTGGIMSYAKKRSLENYEVKHVVLKSIEISNSIESNIVKLHIGYNKEPIPIK